MQEPSHEIIDLHCVWLFIMKGTCMKKPNVIYIYPDQMRYDCMGHAGNHVIKTPAFDRLANEGVSFQNAYTSYPLCCPFRASIMTGKYATSHGMMSNHYKIDLNQKFLPQLLSDAGYQTAWVGKWHLCGGNRYDYVEKEYRLGFENFIGFTRGHNYLEPVYYRNDDRTPYKSDMYEPEMQAEHAIDFIEEASKKDEPFFLGLCFGLPHPNVDLAPEHIKHLYNKDEIQLPPHVPEAIQEQNKEFLAKYYGMISCVDTQIAKIMSALEKYNILEDTVVMVSSDHGEMAGQFGLRAKTIFYKGASQVPFLIRYPKKFPHVKDMTQVVDPAVDIMPTILDICGVEIPEEVEGKSLVKLLETGTDESLPNMSYYQVPIEKDGPEKKPYPMRGLRTKDYVYVERSGAPFAFFDINADPTERVNLAMNEKFYNRMIELHEELKAQMGKIGDTWDKEMVYPEGGFPSNIENLYATAHYEALK